MRQMLCGFLLAHLYNTYMCNTDRGRSGELLICETVARREGGVCTVIFEGGSEPPWDLPPFLTF